MASYHVDNSGSDGDGSLGNPWNNIGGHFNADLSPGDTMYVHGDPVTPQVYDEGELNFTVDGTAVNPITLEPYGSDLVTIYNNDGGDFCLDIDSDYVTIEGKDQLLFDKDNSWGLALGIGGDHNTINDIEAKDSYGNGTDGLVAATGDYNLIDGCVVHDTFRTNSTNAQGILLNGTASYNTIQNCEIYGMHGDCVYISSDSGKQGNKILSNILRNTVGAGAENGIDAKYNSGAALEIKNNTIYGFRACPGTSGGSGDDQGEAVNVHNDCDDVEISGNVIYDCTSGIIVDDVVQNYIIRNNIIRDLVENDPNASGEGGIIVKGTNIDIWNNVLINCPEKSFRFVAPCSDVVVQNNIIIHCADISGEGVSGLTFDHNCWYDCVETISGSGDVTSDPLFTDEANHDYTLQSGSPCINAGTDVGLGYTGSAPDMGAYEYDKIALSALGLTGAAQALTWSGTYSVAMDALSLSAGILAPYVYTLTPITIPMHPLGLAGSGLWLVVAPGPVTLPADLLALLAAMPGPAVSAVDLPKGRALDGILGGTLL